jgi:hypothetical protein
VPSRTFVADENVEARKSQIVDLRIQSLLEKPRSRKPESPIEFQEEIINFSKRRYVGLSKE